MAADVSWNDGAPPASDRYDVRLERESTSRLRRLGSVILDVTGGLAANDPTAAPLDTSRYRYRITIVDTSHDTVVHEENWKGDEAGARAAFERIQRELEEKDVAAFAGDYGISLSSDD